VSVRRRHSRISVRVRARFQGQGLTAAPGGWGVPTNLSSVLHISHGWPRGNCGF